MAEQSISCPTCGKKIPPTRALRAEIESSVKEQYGETLANRERELRSQFADQLKEDLELTVERKLAEERTRLVSEAQKRLTDEHRLKDAKKERQLFEMRQQSKT